MDDALTWDEPFQDLLLDLPPDDLSSRIPAKQAAEQGVSVRRPVRLSVPTEMRYRELAFLCGLLRKKRPKKVLEVGVAAGGTSVVILKALQSLGLPTRLHSVDLSEKYYKNDGNDTGYAVGQWLPQSRDAWDLRTGRVIAGCIGEIGGGIDFCVLDTAHRLPGELFDFLAVLPFLENDAVVVVHDALLHLLCPGDPAYATCLLAGVVAAAKIMVKDAFQPEGLANICAFVVTEDTRKYVANVFAALLMPWDYIPDDDVLADVLAALEAHYPPSFVDYFKRAANLNARAKGDPRRLKTEVSDAPLLLSPLQRA